METADQQLKHVTIGLALGVMASDVEAVTAAKLPIEFGFVRAWRDWDQASSFPSIGRQMSRNVIWRGMHRSEGRQGACAAWHMHRWIEPYLLYGTWTVEDCLELHQDHRANDQDWIALGGLFVATFKPDEIRLGTDPA